MVNVSTFIGDILYFIKNDLISNIVDPISSKRGGTGFVMTSYPEREVKYPIITLKLINQEATRSGMYTTSMDVIANVEVRVWGRNQKEKDTLFTQIYNRLRQIQYTGGGSIENDLHNFRLASATEVDEEGKGPKSRIGQFVYNFYNIS